MVQLARRRLNQEEPRRGGEVDAERLRLLDDEVLDELAAEQLLEEPSAQPMLDLECRPLTQQLERHQQRAVLERGLLNLARGRVDPRRHPTPGPRPGRRREPRPRGCCRARRPRRGHRSWRAGPTTSRRRPARARAPLRAIQRPRTRRRRAPPASRRPTWMPWAPITSAVSVSCTTST